MDKRNGLEAAIIGLILAICIIWYFRYEPINCPEMGAACRMDRWTGQIEVNPFNSGWKRIGDGSRPTPSPEAMANGEK
jgi:hypothetical protein